MSLGAALLIYFLLLVDKADFKIGELRFPTLMEQSLYLMEVLSGTAYTENTEPHSVRGFSSLLENREIYI